MSSLPPRLSVGTGSSEGQVSRASHIHGERPTLNHTLNQPAPAFSATGSLAGLTDLSSYVGRRTSSYVKKTIGVSDYVFETLWFTLVAGLGVVVPLLLAQALFFLVSIQSADLEAPSEKMVSAWEAYVEEYEERPPVDNIVLEYFYLRYPLSKQPFLLVLFSLFIPALEVVGNIYVPLMVLCCLYGPSKENDALEMMELSEQQEERGVVASVDALPVSMSSKPKKKKKKKKRKHGTAEIGATQIGAAEIDSAEGQQMRENEKGTEDIENDEVAENAEDDDNVEDAENAENAEKAGNPKENAKEPEEPQDQANQETGQETSEQFTPESGQSRETGSKVGKPEPETAFETEAKLSKPEPEHSPPQKTSISGLRQLYPKVFWFAFVPGALACFAVNFTIAYAFLHGQSWRDAGLFGVFIALQLGINFIPLFTIVFGSYLAGAQVGNYSAFRLCRVLVPMMVVAQFLNGVLVQLLVRCILHTGMRALYTHVFVKKILLLEDVREEEGRSVQTAGSSTQTAEKKRFRLDVENVHLVIVFPICLFTVIGRFLQASSANVWICLLQEVMLVAAEFHESMLSVQCQTSVQCCWIACCHPFYRFLVLGWRKIGVGMGFSSQARRNREAERAEIAEIAERRGDSSVKGRDSSKQGDSVKRDSKRDSKREISSQSHQILPVPSCASVSCVDSDDVPVPSWFLPYQMTTARAAKKISTGSAAKLKKSSLRQVVPNENEISEERTLGAFIQNSRTRPESERSEVTQVSQLQQEQEQLAVSHSQRTDQLMRQKITILFGNMVTTLGIAEGVSCLSAAVIWLVLPINPEFVFGAGPVNGENGTEPMPVQPLSTETILMNCAIMFLFEVFVTDYLVAHYSSALHQKNPEGCLDVAAVWRGRSRASYRRFVWILVGFSWAMSYQIIMSMCVSEVRPLEEEETGLRNPGEKVPFIFTQCSIDPLWRSSQEVTFAAAGTAARREAVLGDMGGD